MQKDEIMNDCKNIDALRGVMAQAGLLARQCRWLTENPSGLQANLMEIYMLQQRGEQQKGCLDNLYLLVSILPEVSDELLGNNLLQLKWR